MSAVAEARRLSRSFESPDGEPLEVLREIDLLIEAGDSVAIVGPSGSGKSTLLHLLGALDRPTSGEVRLRDQRVSDLTDEELAALRNRYVGFVFQFHHLLRDFSALENVMMPQLVAGTGKDVARARAIELLDQVGLLPRADHPPRKLSGGEQQRVAVARALANDPPLVLADEPSGNLDAEATDRLHDLLFELLDRYKSALVVVTHNRELASRTERVLRLDGGTLAVT
ncbi:MAG: ABC transporter ATP-binding protein [Gemmatimonadota bacterium]|nr:ABC transporter ATP-binding protein [Gemmatimonadota bacterium]